MRLRATAAVCAAMALAATAAACDDDDSDPRADFLKQADRICLRSGLRPKAVPNDNAQAAELLGEEARLRASVHTKLRALRPPDELREDYGRFLELTGEVAGELRRMSAAARADDSTRVAELGRRATLTEVERQRLGERIGFRRCGRPITAPLRSARQ